MAKPPRTGGEGGGPGETGLGDRAARKAAGSYYTPPALVEQLVTMALDPLIERAAARPDAEAALLALRVCDPACGAGHLLAGAAERIARRLGRVRAGGQKPGDGEVRRARGEVVARCLHGTDLQPEAVALCQRRLAALAPEPGAALAALAARVRCGDGVGDDITERYDGVLGNPPFVNAIRGSLTPAARAALRRLYPEFGGTADLAYLMAGAALRRAADGGRVGLVVPRGLLNARSAERFRERLPGGFRLERAWVPPRSDLFPGAAVYVALLAFTRDPGDECAVSLDAAPSHPDGWRRGRLGSSNWWSALQGIAGASPAAREPADSPAAGAPEPATAPGGAATVGDRFEVAASMTAGDAYDVAPSVVDEATGDGPRLVTTGLIDPGICLWGERVCRYLRRDLGHPRLAGPGATASLARRIAASRRPKILVAGLSRVVECFLDRAGEHIGAVSTYSIFHPRDDVGELEALCRYLLSAAVSERFRVELGAGALGGGNTTMRKDFLRALPWPGG